MSATNSSDVTLAEDPDSKELASASGTAQAAPHPTSGPSDSSSLPTDSSMLFDFWYPALRSDKIAKASRKLHTAMLLGIPLVIGRTSEDRLFAMRDNCPHRGIPLSCGIFDGKTLECCYHGWKFEAKSGQCTEIPSLTSDSKLKVDRIFAGSFPCEERDGYAWVYLTSPGSRRIGMESRPMLPSPPALPKFSDRYKHAHLSAELPSTVDHGIIGLMDPAHGPFVHQSWWWRTRHSIHEKQKHFEPIANGFRMSAHSPSANSTPYKLLGVYGEQITTTIDFVLPNQRYEQIRAGKKWFSSLTTVTPITRERCRIDVYAAWNIFYGVPLVTPIAKFFGARFVRQDQRTMEMQAEGLKHNPTLTLIDDADRPAKWYFQLKAAHLESKRSGQAMKHPMSGPVTLKWKS
jgi:phenylpropionate dioxygenase-like ring-hydroxylating dioxygenase large terminal subunit